MQRPPASSRLQVSIAGKQGREPSVRTLGHKTGAPVYKVSKALARKCPEFPEVENLQLPLNEERKLFPSADSILHSNNFYFTREKVSFYSSCLVLSRLTTPSPLLPPLKPLLLSPFHAPLFSASPVNTGASQGLDSGLLSLLCSLSLVSSATPITSITIAMAVLANSLPPILASTLGLRLYL